MDITLRTARDDELDEVGELTARAYLADDLLTYGTADPYLGHLRDAHRRARHALVLVAVRPGSDGPEGDEVLGTVTFTATGGEYAELAGPGEGEFRMLAVRPGARGRGVGEALVRECAALARERRLARLVLSSSPDMASAHRLYGRLGFARTPERDWEPLPGLVLWAFTLDLSA